MERKTQQLNSFLFHLFPNIFSNNRKKGLMQQKIVWVLLFVSLFSLHRNLRSEEIATFHPKLSIKLSGGLGCIAGGSINKHLRTYDTYLSEMTDYRGGETKALHLGSDLEGEIRWKISPKFALSAGTGYFFGKNKSYFEFWGPFPFHLPFEHGQSYIISPRIKTIPLKIGINYTFPSRSRINPFFDIGIGYYFSKATLYKAHWSSCYGPEFLIFTKEEKFDLKARGFGFHGGLGVEYNLANNLALVIEVQGRYSRTRLTGRSISSIWEMAWVEEEGDLFIGERDLLGEGYGERCPDLIVSQSRPSGDEFQNIRTAVLDLSGISLRVGMRIKLF
jgi:outer membrane protein W